MEKLLSKTFASFLSFLNKLFKIEHPLYFVNVYLEYNKMINDIKDYIINSKNKIYAMIIMAAGQLNNDYYSMNKYFMEVLKFNYIISKRNKKELKQIKKYETDLILLLKRTLEGI